MDGMFPYPRSYESLSSGELQVVHAKRIFRVLLSRVGVHTTWPGTGKRVKTLNVIVSSRLKPPNPR